jgi:hypothetical protein
MQMSMVASGNNSGELANIPSNAIYSENGVNYLSSGRELSVHEVIKVQRETYIRKPRKIQTYRDYAYGQHRIVLSPKQKIMLKHILGRNDDEEFCDNVCGQIIFESRGRLKFTGWDCENKEVKDWLRDNYITSKLMDIQVDAHNSMLVDGNHAYSVNFDQRTNRIQVYQEEWWDGYQGLFIVYDMVRNPVFSVKDWLDTRLNIWRRVIWYPDRLERYASTSSNFDQGLMINIPGDPLEGGQPIPWLDSDGEPLGIPYIHLANGFKPAGPYGMSELSGGIIGIQDQINAAQWDLTGGSQMTAYQMYAATGVRFIDDKGRRVHPEVGPGNFLHSPSDKARFNVLPAGDQSQLITVLNEKRSTAAVMSATPLFRMVGKEWLRLKRLCVRNSPPWLKLETKSRS